MDFNTLTKLIKKRRSIFPMMYSNKEISKKTLLQILENANWAPTHKRTEPWRFKIFHRLSEREKLAQYLGGYYRSNTSPDKFKEKKLGKTLKKPIQSACVIAICMKNHPSITIPEWEEVAAVACAVQNMWLSCTSLGIGSYWSSPKSIIEAREFLQLEEHEKCLGLFYMGYSDVEIPSSREPIEQKIIWMGE